MAHAGGRPRTIRAVVLVVLLATAACTAIAGIADKEIDPCFDGCDASAEPDSDAPDAPAEETSTPTDSGTDAGACPCPTGTHDVNSVCVSDLPATNVECMKPLQLPDCPVKLSLRVCDEDPAFEYEATCTSGSNTGPRPSTFIRLGKSPTGVSKLTVVGSHNIAVPNAACDRGDPPCIAMDGGSATKTNTFTASSVPDNVDFVFGKPDRVGCQDISVEVEVEVELTDGG